MARQKKFRHGTPLDAISKKEFGIPWRMADKKQSRKIEKIYDEVVDRNQWKYGDISNLKKKFKY
jgi:hypothetical protein